MKYSELCKESVTAAHVASKHFAPYAKKQQEYFVVLLLDSANCVKRRIIVTIGLLNKTLVHPREVFADAVSERAAGVIVGHNHPSGKLAPSPEDMDITRRLKEAGKILGIPVLDHIIVSKNGFYSFAEAGNL